jgi:hypothetical protein
MEVPAPEPKIRSGAPNSKNPEKARKIRTPPMPNFVSGEGIFSPVKSVPTPQGEEPSPYSYSQESGGSLDQEVHQDRIKDETASASMASEFISSIIDLCTKQTSATARIEFKFTPTRYTIVTRAKMDCSCKDDGSLIHRYKGPIEWHESDGASLCCVEVKSKFQLWDEDGKEVITCERVLAQQVSELLGSLWQRVDRIQTAVNRFRE